jgi:hypothetical protein
MSAEAVKSRKEAEDLLIRKAQQDEGFRRELVANPGGVIADTFGLRVPADLKMTVLEETERQVYLVLPAKSAPSSGGELAERELAMVAGGKDTEDSSFLAKLIGGA